MQNIWVIGDSIAAGITVTEQGKYRFSKQGLPARLQTQERQVHRLARMGACTGQTLDYIARSIPEQADGIALVSLGGNDCNYNWLDVGRQPLAPHIPATPLEQFKSEIKRLFDLLRLRGLTPMAIIPPPLDSKKFFHTITLRGADARGVMRFLGHMARIYEWQEYYALSYAQTVRAAGYPTIDARSAFLQQPDYRQLIGPDGIHPTDSGYTVLSQAVLSALSFA